ncbi:unnamed protein product, partial [Ectocarpus sp. 4 AP-2014]
GHDRGGRGDGSAGGDHTAAGPVPAVVYPAGGCPQVPLLEPRGHHHQRRREHPQRGGNRFRGQVGRPQPALYGHLELCHGSTLVY